MQDFAMHHHEAARQRLREPLQVQLGKKQMRRRRTDVHPDRRQFDVVERPGDIKATVIFSAARVAVMEERVLVVVIAVAFVEKRPPEHLFAHAVGTRYWSIRGAMPYLASSSAYMPWMRGS